jgi:hypothetical protein
MAARSGWTGAVKVVGTHFPEDRDLFESALQRMREAFDGLQNGVMSVGAAQDEFLLGYDTVRDMATEFFLARQTRPTPHPEEDW